MNDTTLLHVADRIFDRPLLIHPGKAEIIAWALRERMPLGNLDTLAPDAALSPEANRFIGSNKRERRQNALSRAHKGVSIIPITGSLVNRGAWIGTSSGLQSYEGISAQLRDAANDDEIHAILLDLNTPGGEATGMFALASLIRQIRQTKHVVAFVDDVAASAGYGIASSADEIVVSATSMVGSIGVVLMHLDRSGELAQKGIKPTLIYSGDHKVDGHPFGPLSDAVKADLQTEVAKIYGLFLKSVSDGRGARLTEAGARATQAKVFLGEDGVKAGLADRVQSFDSLISELSTRSPRTNPGRAQQGGLRMSDNNAQPGATQQGIPLADHQAAVVKATADGKAAGITEGTTAERTRFSSILSSDEAKGRETQAVAIALTGASVEQAKAVLVVTPKGTSLAERNANPGANNPGGLPGTDLSHQSSAKDGWNKATAAYNSKIN